MATDLKAVAYVSKAAVSTDAVVVDSFIDESRRRNSLQGVTGVLLFSGQHFAQYLEGEPAYVDETIARIKRDDRHTDVFVFVDNPVRERRFAGWSLAYSGTASYVDTRLERPTETARRDNAEWASSVLELFDEFSLPQ